MNYEKVSKYNEERNAALINTDVDWIKSHLHGISTEMAIVALHKARYETKSIPDGYRLDSAAWLRVRGHKRMTGEPLLPVGELPK